MALQRKEQFPPRQPGFVLVLFAFLLLIIFTMSAFSIDVGNTLLNQRKIQLAADAGAIAALTVLGPATNNSAVTAEVQAIANANGLLNSEIRSIQCGQWAGGVFTAGAQCDDTSSAIKVTARRSVSTFFGRLLGVTAMTPPVSTISFMTGGGTCVRPFGIDQSIITNGGYTVGSTLTLGGKQNSGNWGKLNIGSGNFDISSNDCDASANLNSDVGFDTGVAGLASDFSQLVGTPAAQNMFIPLTSDFPNGKSQKTVEILGYIELNLTATSGNGNNWQATFTVESMNATPPQGGGTVTNLSQRFLVQ